MNALLQPIKRELLLSDTTLGLIAGFAFVALYSLSGLPLARLADKTNRVKIISLGLAVWSGVTALTGLATSAANSATPAILSDLFPPERPYK